MRRIGFGRHSPSHYIQQLDFLALGPKRGVALLQVVDKTLCVGVTDSHIDLLCELDPETVKAGAPAWENETTITSGRQFAEEVWQRLSRRKDDMP